MERISKGENVYDIVTTSAVKTLCTTMNSEHLYKILELEPEAQIQQGMKHSHNYYYIFLLINFEITSEGELLSFGQNSPPRSSG